MLHQELQLVNNIKNKKSMAPVVASAIVSSGIDGDGHLYTSRTGPNSNVSYTKLFLQFPYVFRKLYQELLYIIIQFTKLWSASRRVENVKYQPLLSHTSTCVKKKTLQQVAAIWKQWTETFVQYITVQYKKCYETEF